MKTILVPTDFSTAADNALSVAKLIARKTNSTLHLAHFYSIPVADYSYPDISMPAEILEQARKSAMQQISDLERQLASDGYKVSSTIDMGLVFDEVVTLADKLAVDLIVMGTTGASGIVNKIMGSNTAHVMQRTERPIILIPEHSKVKDIQKIVYLDELEQDDTEVLNNLLAFADDLAIHQIRILNISTGFFYKPIDEKMVALLENNFGEHKVKIETVDGIDVKEGVDHYLKEHHVDLVVMSTHKKTFLERLFSKSNTQEMALYSKVPLLVYHKKQ
ncbi:MAG TPA: universal stress protein [Chitinophagales bacterium]|nr:universal stress protein [Chitinophagales bacterium]HNM32702.1 universal stress protein [Chitinophagales bacterium]